MKKCLLFITPILLSGCMAGPPPCPVPVSTCPVPTCPVPVPAYTGGLPIPIMGFNYAPPCTAYHPNSFYRCNNSRCVTYSPYAPNKCDPVPYYTQCKHTSCCQGNYTQYF